MLHLIEEVQIKSKSVIVGARQRIKNAVFIPFILSRGNFLNNCVLSQYIMYWINFRNIYTFTFQKTWFHTFFVIPHWCCLELMLLYLDFSALSLIIPFNWRVNFGVTESGSRGRHNFSLKNRNRDCGNK